MLPRRKLVRCSLATNRSAHLGHCSRASMKSTVKLTGAARLYRAATGGSEVERHVSDHSSATTFQAQWQQAPYEAQRDHLLQIQIAA